MPETTGERPASPEQVAGALDREGGAEDVTGLIERLRLPEAAISSDGGAAGDGEGGAAASGGAAACAQCGFRSAEKKSCARCMQVAYCGKE